MNGTIEKNEEKNKKKGSKKVKIAKILLGIAVIAIIGIALSYFIPLMKNLSTTEGKIAFKEKIQNLGPLGMLLLFGLQVAQIFLFFIPGEPLEIIAGMCYGSIGGAIFILISSLITSIAIFLLVRKYGTKFIYEFCDEEKVKKIENSKLFQDPKKIETIMTILFLIPGTPKDLLVYIGGILPIKPVRFILISTLARIPSVISSTYAGAKILEGNAKIGAIIYAVIFVVIVAVVAIINKFDKNKITKEALKVIK